MLQSLLEIVGVVEMQEPTQLLCHVARFCVALAETMLLHPRSSPEMVPSNTSSHGTAYGWVLVLAVGRCSFHSAVTVSILVSVLYYFAMLRSKLLEKKIFLHCE